MNFELLTIFYDFSWPLNETSPFHSVSLPRLWSAQSVTTSELTNTTQGKKFKQQNNLP